MASLECRAVYEKESVVRDHHVYKVIWTPVIGEELEVRTEDDNDHDQHAVAVVKDGVVIGHMPGPNLAPSFLLPPIASSWTCRSFLVRLAAFSFDTIL